MEGTSPGRGENQREKSQVPHCQQAILYYARLWSGPSLGAYQPCTTQISDWPWILWLTLDSGIKWGVDLQHENGVEFQFKKWSRVEFQPRGRVESGIAKVWDGASPDITPPLEFGNGSRAEFWPRGGVESGTAEVWDGVSPDITPLLACCILKAWDMRDWKAIEWI